MPLLSTDPVCLKVDQVTGELVVPFVFLTGAEGVRQRIITLLKLHVGEWFLNMEKGVRWLPGNGVTLGDAILGNDFDRVRLLAHLRDVISSVDGVSSIITIEATESERDVAVAFEVRCAFADTVIELASGTTEVTV